VISGLWKILVRCSVALTPRPRYVEFLMFIHALEPSLQNLPSLYSFRKRW
jgi:hypothetical protein